MSIIIKIILWGLCFATAFEYLTANSTDVLKNTLPIYAIAVEANILSNDSVCKNQLDLFRNGMDNKKFWSLKILDANGVPKPGFIYGNRFWLSSRNQCLDIINRRPFEIDEIWAKNNSKYRDIAEEFPPFNVNYFVAHFRHNSTLQYHMRFPNENLISLSLCLPASCTSNELAIVFEHIFQKRILTVGNLYDADFTLIQINDLKDNHKWLINWRIITVGLIIIVASLMMVVGTTYDIFIYQKNFKIKKFLHQTNDENNKAIGKLRVIKPENYSFTKRPSIFAKIILCFSVYTNAKYIFHTKHTSDSITVIHGLKSLGMLWIIMIHSVLFMSDYVDNRVWSLRMSEGISAQIISNGTLSVDTFFVISGFLLAWIFLKDRKNIVGETKIIDNIKWCDFIGGITKRIIRLTPTYMIILGIAEMNFGWYNETSLFYMSERPQDTCAKYWWRNLLYINNFFGRETMCMSWSWYLSDDMQFFSIGLFLLILSDVYFYTSAALIIILLIISTGITGYISHYYKYTPTLDVQWNMLDIFYYPPWIRIGPYLIGMIAAYILIRINGKLIINKKASSLIWIIGSSCNIFTLFGIFNRNISVMSTAFYVALSRSIWGIGISWLIIACYTKHGGIINKILTWNIWIPLSRLTYCAYLINPLIINSIYLHSERPIHIDVLPNVIIFLGELVIIYICACAITLMTEVPFALILKLFTQSRNNHIKKIIY